MHRQDVLEIEAAIITSIKEELYSPGLPPQRRISSTTNLRGLKIGSFDRLGIEFGIQEKLDLKSTGRAVDRAFGKKAATVHNLACSIARIHPTLCR